MNKKTAIITGVAAFVLLLAGYIGAGVYYQSHFLPNSTVGTVSVAGDTVEEANRKIAKNLLAQNVSITENGQELASVSPAQLEVEVDATTFLQQAKENQGGWSWPVALFQDSELMPNETTAEHNPQAMQALIDSLGIDSSDRTEAKSANVKTENGEFVVEEEVYGTTVDQAKLEELIIQKLVSGEKEVKLEDAFKQPALTKDSPELAATVEKLSDLADTKITYQIAGKEEVVPRDLIITWLSLDEQGEPTVDKEMAREYLRTLHDKYATYDKTRKFESTNRGTVEVPPGEYGWSVGTLTEMEYLAEYILKGEDVTTRPVIEGSGYQEDGTDIGDSYVEVDLEAQIMYMYKDGKLVFESPIVAGHPQTPTPVGVFYAWDKVEDTELIGYNPRRDADYATPVDYWVPVNWTGIGIHDASWQASFGPEEWKTDGSNGCINTPPGAMDEFFALLEVGMPVILF